MSWFPKQPKKPMEIKAGYNDDFRYVTYERFDFPDGQPHIKLNDELVDCNVAIKAAITSPDDLFELLMLKNVLNEGDNHVNLAITYLMGARMDKRIDGQQPHTLMIVCQAIATEGFEQVGVLDPHSDVVGAMISLVTPFKKMYPGSQVRKLLNQYNPATTRIVIPDAGAEDRVLHMTQGTPFASYIRCTKERDSQTGKLSHFTITNPADVNGMVCLIIDDICDGGRTFEGIATLLRDAGATGVDLFVTHGIFSRGGKLAGIDRVYTTDSYPGRRDNVITFPLDKPDEQPPQRGARGAERLPPE